MRKLKFALALLLSAMLFQESSAQVVYEVAKKPGDTLERPKVGVVMSGGGAKGFAHIRALKAIEDAGIPIDYIAGTSMGSIIGGLYAVGYDPDVMEDLTTHQNWDLIIMDKVPRKYMSLDNRFNKRNYLLRLPIIDGKIKIKSAFVDGVYVNMLLTRLTLPAYKQRDFNKLSVPFFCVATDMTTADPVIWESGSIARAIRSSMSIPFLFAPIDYGDKLLCDGGLLNNFPVRLMREKGADIVIGIDLENDYIDKAKLDNSLKILERLIAVVSQHESNKAREECDILIRPDVGNANMLSFNDFSPILECGEKAGKEHEMELKALADSLQKIHPFKIERPHVQPMNSIHIDEVEVEGVSSNDVKSIKSYFLDKGLPRNFTIDEIEEIIVKNYSTGFYSDIWYEVKDVEGENVLVMHCKSNSYQTFGLAAHYDNNYRMQVLLNYSMMHVSEKYKRRSLSIDACVADHPYLRINYAKHVTNKFRIGAKASALLLKLNMYASNKSVYAMYGIQDNKLDLYMQYVPNLHQQLSLGLVTSYSQIKDKMYSMYEVVVPYKFYPHIVLRYFYNNEDDADFATKGWNVDFIAKYSFHNPDADGPIFKNQFVTLKLDANKSFPIGKKMAIRTGVVGTMPIGREVLPKYFSVMSGGQSRMRYFDNIIPIIGVPFASELGDFLAFIKTAYYYNMWKGLYASVNCDIGFSSFFLEDWFSKPNFGIGGGLTVGYKTPIGPVEICVSRGNMYDKPVMYINLGFWF